MDNSLYTNLSDVCHSFYSMYFPHEKIADIIDKKLEKFGCKKIVFFGGLVEVAKILQERGYEIIFADYTEDMVNHAKKVLTGMDFIVSDMRDLALREKQDAIVLMGRILSYMYTNDDMLKAMTAFKKNLKKDGVVLMDSYEEGKITNEGYFTGTIELKKGNHILRRISNIKKKHGSPPLYRWDCIYEDISDGNMKVYNDENHILRAFGKEEIKEIISMSGLKFIESTENFEKISFFTVAQNP